MGSGSSNLKEPNRALLCLCSARALLEEAAREEIKCTHSISNCGQLRIFFWARSTALNHPKSQESPKVEPQAGSRAPGGSLGPARIAKRHALNFNGCPSQERAFLRTLADRFYAEQVIPSSTPYTELLPTRLNSSGGLVRRGMKGSSA